MADRRKRSPAMRYIKRNGLYILIVCVLLLVVGAVIAVVGQVKRLSPAKQEEPSQSASETVQQPTLEEPSSDASGETASEQEPVDESAYVPPFSGRTALLADSGLVITFDDAALSWEESEDLISLTDAAGAQKRGLMCRSSKRMCPYSSSRSWSASASAWCRRIIIWHRRRRILR